MSIAKMVSRRVVSALGLLVVAAMVAVGQGKLVNGGTFQNTGTSTFKEVSNYNTAGGKIYNAGSLTVTTAGGGSGHLVNTDSSALAGHVENFISGTGNGTISVAGTLFNNFAGATFDNDSSNGVSTLNLAGAISTGAGTFSTATGGRVVYNGTSAQNILATTYGALATEGAAVKTLAGAVTVSDSARIEASSTLAVSTSTLTVNAPTGVAGGGTLTSELTGTVDYAADANQAVFPATYGNVTLSGSTTDRNKSASGNVTVGGTLTTGTNDSLDVIGGNVLAFSNGSTIDNGGGIKASGNVTFGTGMTITDAGTFVYYASAGSQDIGAFSYNSLILRNAGDKNFLAATYSVTEDFLLEGSDSTSTTFASGNVFRYVGTGAQSVAGDDYRTLEFANSGLKTIAATAVRATAVNVASTVTAGLQINSGASLTVQGGDLTNDGTIINNGTVTVE